MSNFHIFKNQVVDFRSTEKQRYNVWVYDADDVLKVFTEQKPNTKHLWFEFYSFSNLYWKMLEQDCIESIKGMSFYNHAKIKLFMIKYLFCNTNFPCIKLQRTDNGELTEKSFEQVMKIHPRIWRTIFDMVDVFPNELSQQEQKKLQKQCAILFGQGNSVSHPHQWIVTYCNLVAFWDKFGMNYYDILKLPHETFLFLKKVMSLQMDYRNRSMNENKNSAKGKKGVSF